LALPAGLAVAAAFVVAAAWASAAGLAFAAARVAAAAWVLTVVDNSDVFEVEAGFAAGPVSPVAD
jgi:hypothetical protein